MRTTKIEWTDKTWNPITGCSKISEGCTFCYAEVMSKRLHAMGLEKYRNVFNVTLHESVLTEPLKWKKPHTIFVCSMSDIFHKDVPFEFVDKIIDVIKTTPIHNYQLLTKRADRMNEYFTKHREDIPKNAWLGVTVDVAKSKDRIDYLRDLDATIKFLSCEPLLEDLGDMNLKGIDWVIAGGESGVNARPMKEECLENVKNETEKQNATFFFKQWGTWGSDGVKRNKKVNGKLLKGEVHQSMPPILFKM